MADSGNPIPQAANEGNTWRFRDDPVPDEPAVSLDAFFDQPDAASVRIEAGDDVRASEAYADASYYAGRPFDAMEQLKRLLKRNDLDYYARARIQARITELTPLVLELRKRKIQTEDNPDGRQQQLQQGEDCLGRLCLDFGTAPVDAWH